MLFLHFGEIFMQLFWNEKCYFSHCLGERDGVKEVVDAEHELSQCRVREEEVRNSWDFLLYFFCKPIPSYMEYIKEKQT